MITRRQFLATGALATTALAAAAPETPPRQAQIAITFDLEMARNFPRWEDTHWDYEKGNLNEATKHYALEAARRVKARGGVIHFFVVGRVFEQENVDWLKELNATGHPIGNHTYDHVYLLATRPQDLQFRFNRAPWLIEGKTPAQAIRDNIQLCSEALKTRLGIGPAGFRTPGGFADGLHGREDVQRLLLEFGFKWASCKYPVHAYSAPGQPPSREVFASIVKAQAAAQPFRYPTGLIDIPMSPISDVGAFRTCRWKLDHLLDAIRQALDWVIAERMVFDFLAHPAVLYPNDPEFRVVELICDLVQQAGTRARLTDLDTIARHLT